MESIFSPSTEHRHEQQHQEDGEDTQPLSKINSHVRMTRSKQTDPLSIYTSNTCKETLYRRLHAPLLERSVHDQTTLRPPHQRKYNNIRHKTVFLQLQETNISR